MKLALRDDDTSYYTNREELDTAFRGLEKIPISLSVVPFSVSDHTGNHPYGKVFNSDKYADIAENRELVAYIKEGVKEGHFEVIQHGIHHEYIKNQNGDWISETEFLNKTELEQNMIMGKLHLEKIFNVRINTFAAPSNAISPECSEILDQIRLNTNCIVGRCMKRKVTFNFLKNYIKSNVFRFFTGSRFCGVLSYKHHNEMNIFEFTTYESAWKQYIECKKYDFPMIIYTHYWNLNIHEEKRKELVEFIRDAIDDGAEPSFVSDCF